MKSFLLSVFFAMFVCLAFVSAQDETDVDDNDSDYELGYSKPYDDIFKKVCDVKIVLIKKPLTYWEAKKVCYKLGGRLLAVTNENFKCFAWYLYKIQQSPVWIGSWNGDDYKNKGIALYAKSKFGKGAIAVPREKKLYALCEKKYEHKYTKYPYEE
jgi:hypothetical protein